MFFNVSEQLCQRYTSLNPFFIREQRSCEVFMLLKRVISSNNTSHTNTKVDGEIIIKPNGDKIIRREAKNDDWY